MEENLMRLRKRKIKNNRFKIMKKRTRTNSVNFKVVESMLKLRARVMRQVVIVAMGSQCLKILIGLRSPLRQNNKGNQLLMTSTSIGTSRQLVKQNLTLIKI